MITRLSRPANAFTRDPHASEKKVLFGSYMHSEKAGMLQVNEQVEDMKWQTRIAVSSSALRASHHCECQKQSHAANRQSEED